jgi:hypothetical protein
VAAVVQALLLLLLLLLGGALPSDLGDVGAVDHAQRRDVALLAVVVDDALALLEVARLP